MKRVLSAIVILMAVFLIGCTNEETEKVKSVEVTLSSNTAEEGDIITATAIVLPEGITQGVAWNAVNAEIQYVSSRVAVLKVLNKGTGIVLLI